MRSFSHLVLLACFACLLSFSVGFTAKPAGVHKFEEVLNFNFTRINDHEFTVSFIFRDESMFFDFERVRGLYTNVGSIMLASGKDHVLENVDAVNTYRSKQQIDNRIAVATLYQDGSFSGVFETQDGFMINVATASHLVDLFGRDEFDRLNTAPEGTVVLGHDVEGIFTGDSEEEVLGNLANFTTSDGRSLRSESKRFNVRRALRDRSLGNSSPIAENAEVDTDGKPLRASASSEPSYTVSGCFPNSDAIHEVTIGIVIDKPFYDYYSSRAVSPQQKVEGIIAKASEIYRLFFNVVLKVGKIIVVDGKSSDSVLDSVETCKFKSSVPVNGKFVDVEDSDSSLDALGAFLGKAMAAKKFGMTTEDNGAAFWHRFTKCDWGNTVGRAYLSVACEIGTFFGTEPVNTGTNNVYPKDPAATELFITIAHETGHMFSATHQFGNGGIMDYGDGVVKKLGIVGFLPATQSKVCKYIKDEMYGKCKYFSQQGPSSIIAPNEPANSVCGNGILEDGEDCECEKKTKSCYGCKRCKFTSKTDPQCSSSFFMRTAGHEGPFKSDSACCVNGILQPADKQCSSGGFCISGECRDFCKAESDNFAVCRAPLRGGCVQVCKYQNLPYCMSTWKLNGKPISILPDGAACTADDGSIGQCKAAQCVAA